MRTDRRAFLKLAGAATFTLAANPARAQQSGKVEVLWLGQAATKLTSPTGKVIVIDPFLTQNPRTPDAFKRLEALGHVDLILVTHGHRDHTGDVAELARRTGVKVLGNAGLVDTMVSLGWIPADQGVRFNKGGVVTPVGPQIKVTQVRAEHSSEIVVTNPETKQQATYPGGEPVGFVVEMESGFKLYHMGDTGIFGDMRFIGEYYRPDLVLIPIGGHFVMSPQDAAYATREMLKPRLALPIHYGTFPVLKGTPQEYQTALGQGPTRVLPIQPGEKLSF
jgi:L-ascorbate metabolism protein UlaG (beta-lactamase superfamily)